MALCSIEGCEGTAKARGWCQAHYMRWWATGNVGAAEIVRRPKGRTCSVDGCERRHQGRGYCEAHLRRFLKYGEPGSAVVDPRNPGAICKIDECEQPARARGWCNAHYLRWRKTGDPLTPVPDHGGRWTGSDATYTAIHQRIKKIRGSAKRYPCVSCGEPAAQWAYDHSDPAPKYNPNNRPYSLDLSRYMALCLECHRRLDAARTRTQGCSVLGCEGRHKAHGLCGKHYQQLRAAKTL